MAGEIVRGLWVLSVSYFKTNFGWHVIESWSSKPKICQKYRPGMLENCSCIALNWS